MFERKELSEAECMAEFAALFPQGPAGADLMSELAPAGWRDSPLRFCFHPSVERAFEEAVQIHRNIERAFGGKGKEPSPPPTFEEIAGSHVDPPLEPERELAELIGRCVWDIFSDNHEVVTQDGRVSDLGSFRASAGFIADWLNENGPDHGYDYMDFYLGTIWIGGRADLTPVYEAIFRRLRARGQDWIYHFPRLGLVDMRPIAESLKPETPDWTDYDPSRALEQQREAEEHERSVSKMREELDKDYREAVEKAQDSPLPDTVVAYRKVYGRLPSGWPPEIPPL